MNTAMIKYALMNGIYPMIESGKIQKEEVSYMTFKIKTCHMEKPRRKHYPKWPNAS